MIRKWEWEKYVTKSVGCDGRNGLVNRPSTWCVLLRRGAANDRTVDCDMASSQRLWNRNEERS